jgi:tetratricopeptide (TPR) repeat protein
MMLDPRAESTFQQGIDLMQRGQSREALAFLRAAVDLDDGRPGSFSGQARYESYYGLCLSSSPNQLREALTHCRKAVQMEAYRADVWLNLGRVAQAAGRRGEAFRAFEQGRLLDPTHKGITKALRKFGTRRPPVVAFLPRQNPLNVLLGRMRT